MANYIVKEHNGSDGADSRTKGTISVWVKRSTLGTAQGVWSWGENNSSDSYCRFDAGDNLEFHSDGAGSPYNTTRLFRDPNAWYHIVFAMDISHGTEAYRRRIYINGVEDVHGTSCSSGSAAVFGHNSVQDLYIGDIARQQQNAGNAMPFNGYMSHFHYCDGYQYAASDFGETDATTGEWKPKTAPSVTYGTHGIFLKMEDSSNMDLDSSPNASSQLSTTGTILSVKDCPSDVFCTMNPLRRFGGNLTLSQGNNTITETASNWQMSSATLGANKGKFYYEYKITTIGLNNGYVKMGITSDIAGDDAAAAHGAGSSLDGGYAFYCQDGSLEARTDDAVISGWSTGDTGITFALNDVLCMAIDMDNKFIYFRKNGDAWAKSGDPTSGATGTGGINISSDYPSDNNKFAIPTLAIYSGGAGSVNFGNGYFGTTAISSAGTNASNIGIFEHDVPTGYTAFSGKGINA